MEHRPATRPRERLTAPERRARIITAARELFSRDGYHATSTAEIARAAGCSEPMLYKHFPSKQALFTAVLEQVSAETEASMDKVLESPGNLAENWLSYLPSLFRDRNYAEMVCFRNVAATLRKDDIVQTSLRNADRRMRERTRRALERAKEQGLIRKELEVDQVANMWLGLTLAGCYRANISGDQDFADILPTVQSWLATLRD